MKMALFRNDTMMFVFVFLFFLMYMNEKKDLN